MTDVLRRLLFPALAFAVSAGFLIFGDDAMREVSQRFLGQTYAVLPYILSICLWISAAALVSRLIDVFVWGRLVTAATGTPTPRLIRQLSTMLIYLVGIMGIVGVVFEKSVTGLLATSGAVGLVLGLALRSLILDLFSGVALNVERPFHVGEFINVQPRGVTPFTGQVQEVNWRTTRLLTPENSLQVVPNSLLGASTITNYSRPDPISEFEQTLCLDFSVDSARALTILNASLHSVAEDGKILAMPEPKARITRTDELGVVYKLKYFIDPRRGGPGKVRHFVLQSALNHLHQAGLEPAYPKLDTYNGEMPDRQLALDGHRSELLGRVALFADFSEAQIDTLAQAALVRKIEAGDVVVRQGDTHSASMYVIVEGVLDVVVRDAAAGTEDRVGLLRPGDFFGEMSLLTGAPRSATVVARTDATVFEVTKDHIAPLLADYPETTHLISETIAARQLANQRRRDSADQSEDQPERALASQIMGRIRSFFGLRGGAAAAVGKARAEPAEAPATEQRELAQPPDAAIRLPKPTLVAPETPATSALPNVNGTAARAAPGANGASPAREVALDIADYSPGDDRIFVVWDGSGPRPQVTTAVIGGGGPQMATEIYLDGVLSARVPGAEVCAGDVALVQMHMAEKRHADRM